MFAALYSNPYFKHFVCLSLAFVIASLFSQKSDWAQDIPWVGGFNCPVSRFFAPWLSLARGRALLEESYYKFGKKSQVCIMPVIFGNVTMLPPSMIPWLVQQPERILSAKSAQVDAVQAALTMLRPEVALKPVHEEVVKKKLKTHLGSLTEAIMDEIECAVNEICGVEAKAWKAVKVDEMVRMVITRASNRAFLGLPLCREPEFVENTIRYVDDIPAVGLLLKLCPALLRPGLATLLTLRTRYHYSKCARHLVPFIRKSIAAWHLKLQELPDSYATWSIEDAMKYRDKVEQTPDMLSRRVMALNFAAIHTSTMTTVNLILDLASAPTQQGCLKRLSEENDLLHRKYGVHWTRARIAEMIILDSALRESMRISGFGSKAFNRKVTAPQGVLLPNGVLIPQGAAVSVSGYSLHRDESIYPRPDEFLPERFSRFDGKLYNHEEITMKTAATTEPTYAIWGHGKHACPGRFFAIDMIKMLVAYLISNYDIKEMPERPKNVWIVDTPIPPRNAKIEIKRRWKGLRS